MKNKSIFPDFVTCSK